MAAVAATAAAAGSRFQSPTVRGSLVDDVATRCGRVGGTVDGQRCAHVMMQRVLMTVQAPVRSIRRRGGLNGRDRRDALVAVTDAVTAAITAGTRVDRTDGFDLTAAGQIAG